MSNIANIMGMAAGGGGGIPAWAANLATGTSNRDNFTVSSIVGWIVFNDDGTKLIACNYSSQAVEYVLSTAYDLSTISASGNTFSMSSQNGEMFAATFSFDGTKMYGTGRQSNDGVYQYSLSTPFDITTASYDSVFFSVASQDNDPQGTLFKPDGTKMYVMSKSNSYTLFQYTLSTAWDISTASYDSVSFNFVTQNNTPRQVYINYAGDKMYMIGSQTSVNYVYEYDLSTPYDISTASYNGVSLNILDSGNPNGGSESPYGVTFSLDGTVMVIKGGTYSNLISWDLS